MHTGKRTHKYLILLFALLALLLSACRQPVTPPETEGTDAPTLPATDPVETKTPVLVLPVTVVFHDVTAPVGAEVSVDMFVTGLTEGITTEFLATPDTVTPGASIVHLLFRSGTLSLTIPVNLYVFSMNTDIKKDINEEKLTVSAREFVPDENVEAELVDFDPSAIDRKDARSYPVRVRAAGVEYACTVTFAHMTIPSARLTEVSTMVGVLPEPGTLIGEYKGDGDLVSVTYSKAPDITTASTQEYELELTDSYGNVGHVTGSMEIIEDSEPPVITGARKTIYVVVGGTIEYKKDKYGKDIVVTDNSGAQIDLVVDNSQVDKYKAGTYQASYSATDPAGNTTTVGFKVQVDEVNEKFINSMCDYVIKKIITDGMSLDEKIYAIWKFSKEGITYIGTSDKTDLYHGAYQGFQTMVGDCYTYYAVNTALFNRLGINSVEVRRVGGQSNHWWSLVQFSDGLWYHVDSCLGPNAISKYDAFKMTEETLEYYMELVERTQPGRVYYQYDHSLPQYEGLDIATEAKVKQRKENAAPVETSLPDEEKHEDEQNG